MSNTEIKTLVVDSKLHQELKIQAIKNKRTLQEELAKILERELRE